MTQRHEEKDDAIVVEGRLYGRQDSHFTERIHAAVQYCQSSWASGARFSCKPARWLDADRHRKCLQSRLRTCDFPVNIRRRFTFTTARPITLTRRAPCQPGVYLAFFVGALSSCPGFS
jgi:hypothetical protein